MKKPRERKPLTPQAKKRLSRILTGCVVAIVAVLVFALSQLIPKLQDYQASDQAFSELADHAITAYDPAEQVTEPAEEDSDPPDLTDAMAIDWEAFGGTDIVAWVQCKDISYPVMQGDDNAYYLHHLPDGEYNTGGSIFLLAENNPLFTDQNSIVYGHNRANGSMFGKLKRYANQDSAESVFYIYLPDGTRHTYRFFSVNTVYQDSKAYTWSFSSDASFVDWQNWMLSNSLVDTGESADAAGKFVCLSTCNGSSGTTQRLVICGREERVDTLQEPASWYASYMEQYQAERSAWVDRAGSLSSGLTALQQQNRETLWQERRKGSE